ncbi:MAG: DUF951 domain-containing protein [Chloroflexi bacterium]|nr:DUF951 domain-containing protein [Chloroflexota bacterium]
MDLRLGDLLKLKKPHPCGGSQWEVVRLGLDIGIVCQTCGRRTLMARSQLERRVKQVHPLVPSTPAAGSPSAR